VLLTWGELGIPKGSIYTPNQMKHVRRNEFEHATDSLGIKREVLDLGDLQLTEKPFTELMLEVLKVIRRIDPAVIFSFYPYEITPYFDHPDHNIAGKLTLHVGATSDVRQYHPDISAVERRPEIFLWTTDKNRATYAVKLSKKCQERRDMYAISHYPSQFSTETHPQWRQIFDRIGGVQQKRKNEKSRKSTEYWFKVR
jgi:LmbE family N-acetylglucosaminyl deacetylase